MTAENDKANPPPTKKILLTQGYYAIVDADMYDLLANFKWQILRKHTGDIKARTAVYDPGKQSGQRTVFMHRLVMNAPDDAVVDHINHNGLDNRRANLRICSNTQNTWNARKKKKAISPYKGVHPCRKRWRARITFNGKTYNIPLTYATQEEAARAYNKAAKTLYGEFACLNTIPFAQQLDVTNQLILDADYEVMQWLCRLAQLRRPK